MHVFHQEVSHFDGRFGDNGHAGVLRCQSIRTGTGIHVRLRYRIEVFICGAGRLVGRWDPVLCIPFVVYLLFRFLSHAGTKTGKIM